MNVYDILRKGSCAIARRMAEIEMLWKSCNVKDGSTHELWDEYELLMDSLCCIAMGMAKGV